MIDRQRSQQSIQPNIHYTRFSVTGKLPTCCALVSNTANKSTTSCQEVVVMEFGKWHDTTDTTDFCPRWLVTKLLFMLWTWYGEVANLLRTCYRETDEVDFGVAWTGGRSLLTWCKGRRLLGAVVHVYQLNTANSHHHGVIGLGSAVYLLPGHLDYG